jgi:hypothetical protein
MFIMRTAATICFAVICLLAARPASPALGQEPQGAAAAKVVTVEATSGRTFTGQVDAQTNAARLVLRTSRGGAHLLRPIEWSRIVKATLDGQQVEPARLREIASQLQTAAPRAEFASPAGEVAPPPVPPLNTAHVAYITFDARLANWNASVETDGLLIDILPLDADGYLAAATGTITVELFAQQRRDFQYAPQSGGRTVERVERWTREVQAEQFGANGDRLKLPFGAVQPELDDDWLAMGLVHVKFTAPGHGIFEDSRDAIRIRPFAPNRDHLDTNTGRRFLPTEGVGRRN